MKGLKHYRILLQMRNDLLEFIQTEHGILKQECKIVISMATAISSQIKHSRKTRQIEMRELTKLTSITDIALQ